MLPKLSLVVLIIFCCINLCKSEFCRNKLKNCYEEVFLREETKEISFKFNRSVDDVTLLDFKDFSLKKFPDVRKFKNLNKIGIELRENFEILNENFFDDVIYKNVKEINIDTAPRYRSRFQELIELNFYLKSFPNLSTLEIHNFNFGLISYIGFSYTLENVFLRFNKIRILTDFMFMYLDNLKKLWIDNNQITDLPYNLFFRNKKLKELNCMHNKIKKIPENLFLTVDKLEVVWFGSNQLEYLSGFLFKNSKNLKEIHFENNKISKISLVFFDNLNLEVTSFYGNPCVEDENNFTSCYQEWKRFEVILDKGELMEFIL